MPVVALPLLSLFIDIKLAAMLLSMPLIFSNVPQALEGGETGRCLMQLMPVILGIIPGLFLGVRVLLMVNANVAKIISRPSAYGCGRRHAARGEATVSASLGFTNRHHIRIFGGILGGIAAMSGPLVFIYLLAKGLSGRGIHKRKHRSISSFPPACWQFF